MSQVADLVQEQSNTTGIGTWSLLGPSPGSNRRSFASAMSNGLVFYAAYAAGGVKMEVGFGTLTAGSPDQIARNATTIISYDGTSHSTSRVNFGAGDMPLTIYSAPLNHIINSLLKTNAGTSRPAWLPQYGIWLKTDTPSATVWTAYLYDGSNDIPIGTFDSVNNLFVPAGAMPLTGGTFTGNVSISKTTPAFTLNTGNAAENAELIFAKNGSTRFKLYKDATAEGGSDAGSDLGIARYSDAGSLLDTPFLLKRSSGLLTLSKGLTVSGQGLQLGAPTGGDKGAGTLNSAGALYVNNVNFINSAGNLQIAAFNGGSGASADTFWRGDGAWATAGGWKRHAQLSTSFQATVGITDIPSSARALMVIVRIGLANDNANARIQYYKGGPTAITTGTEMYGGAAATNVSGVFSLAQGVDNNGNYQTTAVIFLHDLQAGIYKQGWSKSTFQDNGTNAVKGVDVHHSVQDTSAVIGLEFTASSGNIAIFGNIFIAE